MDALTRARERLRPHVERARAFSGWDPSLEATSLTPEPGWDYMRRAAELMQRSASALDLGTGGGERFGQLCEHYGGRAVATEEWQRNAPIAARHLRRWSVDVVRCRSPLLPFRDACFELVLNRHEELDPAETARVLAPGGVVLTQQVQDYWAELRRFFPRMTHFGDLFAEYRAGFESAGLEVVGARSHHGLAAYRGLGDIVYMLCIAPWTIPDFDPLGADLPALLQMERQLTAAEGIVLSEGSFIIEARRPA